MTPTFGTDGVRGAAFSELTVDYVQRLGRVAVEALALTDVVVTDIDPSTTAATTATFALTR